MKEEVVEMNDNESVELLKIQELGNTSEITVVSVDDDDTSLSVPAQTSERKLTPKQLEKLKEKEERERKRLEEKLSRERAKEEEKRLKEEKRQQQLLERKKKQEEKDRIKRENELKREQLRKEREEKEKQKQEEKLKKEQERLQKEQEKKLKEEQEKKKKDKLKISNFFKPKTSVKSTSVLMQQQQQQQQGSDHRLRENDYRKSFKPFFIREGVTLAGDLSKEQLTESVNDFDKALENECSQSDLLQWFRSLPVLKEEGENEGATAQYIYENGLTSAPIRIKFIKFYESVKSWIGSYTQSCHGLGSDPLRTLDKEFIDFDDVIDEDDDGEGEDIDDEDDDEDDDDDDEDEMTDFLEEDNNGGNSTEQRKKILGPLIPVITWGNSDQTSAGCIRFEVLKPNVSLPLDPSFNYWQTQQQQSNGGNAETPLKKKSKTMITDRDDLEKFADKVHDCEFSIPTMVEILKKELPNYTKITIENTLRSLATKVGSKQTEKKWQVDHDSLNRLCSLQPKE